MIMDFISINVLFATVTAAEAISPKTTGLIPLKNQSTKGEFLNL